MATISKQIVISGICLMDGRECIVKIAPSDEKGIFFYPDNSDIKIKASTDNVISTLHCMVLGNGDKQVRVVEHFMAACAFSGIDSLNVYLNSSEMPILDGSALKWIELFNNAGIVGTVNGQAVSIEETIEFKSANAKLVLLPADTFKVSYYVNFEHPDLHEKWYNWDSNEDTNEIISARTFGYLKDLEKFQKAGFALGAQIDNTIGLTETGYTIELRSQYEPIKHKILDLIGDLNLLDINPLNLKAHIVAQEAGHASHIEFARMIKKYLEGNLCQQTKN